MAIRYTVPDVLADNTVHPVVPDKFQDTVKSLIRGKHTRTGEIIQVTSGNSFNQKILTIHDNRISPVSGARAEFIGYDESTLILDRFNKFGIGQYTTNQH